MHLHTRNLVIVCVNYSKLLDKYTKRYGIWELCYPFPCCFLQISGELEWAEAAIEGLRKRCEFVIIANPGDIDIDIDFDLLCPAQCNGNGVCKAGKWGLKFFLYVFCAPICSLSIMMNFH
jgi:hypothetical protein